MPIPKVLTGLAGRRFGPPAQQPTSMPLFEHKMTPKSLFLTLYRPPKVISQPLQTLQEKMGQLSPLLAVTSEIFGFHTAGDPQNTDFGGDQYPIYIPILRELFTNIQYQYLESFKTIFLDFLNSPTALKADPRLPSTSGEVAAGRWRCTTPLTRDGLERTSTTRSTR